MVADHYGSNVANEKFEMADSMWREFFFTKFDVFRSNCTKMSITGLLWSRITILRSKMRDSKWRI